MRLLFVLPEYLPQEGGGIITFYRHLLPTLAAGGHQVHVLVGSAFTQGDVDEVIDGVRVCFLPRGAFLSARDRFTPFAATPEVQNHLAAAWALWETAKEGGGFDCVETTDWGLLFLPWLTASSPPVVVQLHGSVGQIARRDPLRGQELAARVIQMLEGAGLGGAAELQTYSESNANAWRATLGRDVTVIRPAWRLGPSSKRQERTSNGLVVARIQRWKGPDVLCRALDLLGEQAPTVEWVGRDTVDGTTGGSYAAGLARRYPRVWGRLAVPLGPRSFAETEILRGTASFVVVPSIWDVFNFTVVEAMASGLPVLCSRGAGAAELIEDGISGFTFPVDDANALAGLLQHVAALSADERAAMGDAARERIRRLLDPDSIAEHRLARYASLASGQMRANAPPTWLAEAVAPGQPLGDPWAFLHHLPLRGILRHAATRLIERIRR